MDLVESISRWKSAFYNNKSMHVSTRGGSRSRAVSWEMDPVESRAQPILKQVNKLTESDKEELLALVSSVTSKNNILESKYYPPLQDIVSTFVADVGRGGRSGRTQCLGMWRV